MAIDNFIPQIWSARLLENLNKTHVFASVCNKAYTGDIRAFGDRVHINGIGRITIGDYTKNTDIGAPETLTDAQKTLIIDQGKYFNFQIDDIDAAQQTPKLMDAAMREAAYGLADVADKYIANLYSDESITNTIGTDDAPKKFTAVGDAYEALVSLSVKLSEANVPKNGRWVVVPAWYIGLLLKDERFVAAGTAMSDNALSCGLVGKAAGFDIYTSNNVATVTGADDTLCYKVMAGYENSIAYAEQITEVEAYRPEKRFADAVKGLHLYGAKIVKPDSVGLLTVARPEALI